MFPTANNTSTSHMYFTMKTRGWCIRIPSVFSTGGFRVKSCLHVFTRHAWNCFSSKCSCAFEREVTPVMTVRENTLKMLRGSPRLCIRRIVSPIGVLRKQLWRALPGKDLYTYYERIFQNPGPGGLTQCMDLGHCITAYRQLLSAILFKDEAFFTRNSISNSEISIRLLVKSTRTQ